MTSLLVLGSPTHRLSDQETPENDTLRQIGELLHVRSLFSSPIPSPSCPLQLYQSCLLAVCSHVTRQVPAIFRFGHQCLLVRGRLTLKQNGRRTGHKMSRRRGIIYFTSLPWSLTTVTASIRPQFDHFIRIPSFGLTRIPRGHFRLVLMQHLFTNPCSC